MKGSGWSAFATGKQNGKFGLYGFYQRAKNSYALQYINASHRRAVTLWRILSDRQKKCVVVNVPLTWPVEEINGAVVSEWPYLGAVVDNPAALRFGARSNGNGSECFAGYLDELAIYDYALSDARISAHYQAGIGN